MHSTAYNNSSVRLLVRVYGEANQGARQDMEDKTSVVFENANQQTFHGPAFFAVFDGHGGSQAAAFARDFLWQAIKNHHDFHSKSPSIVIEAIKKGFAITQDAMWKQRESWPHYKDTNLPSTAGTTVTSVILHNGQIYVAHLGDSAAIMASKVPQSDRYKITRLTQEHKPGFEKERRRIESLGGVVRVKINDCGISECRVAWKRLPKKHLGRVRRSTRIEVVPFLNISRSLGDLWSYEPLHKQFAVSPVPDVTHHTLNLSHDQFIVLGTDGLWNVLSPEQVIRHVTAFVDSSDSTNASTSESMTENLINRVLTICNNKGLRADNISVIIIHLQAIDGSNTCSPACVSKSGNATSVFGTITLPASNICADV